MSAATLTIEEKAELFDYLAARLNEAKLITNWRVAKAYAKLYQLHEIFTLDIADTPEGYKIVEYNCWACSGLYASDKNKLFLTVNDYVKNKSCIVEH